MVVEPGIGWMELNDYLQPYGLFFPLDPGLFLKSSFCKILLFYLPMHLHL